MRLVYLLILVLCVGMLPRQLPQAPVTKPNFIYILADDMGLGDVSAYNAAARFRTPHIDKLASEGMSFTDAHSGSAVCTPTRYGILTGRYSWRSKLKKGVTWSYDSALIEDKRMTVASFLKQNGYHTASVGKWHLGLNWAASSDTTQPVDFAKPVQKAPNYYGFDYSYIIPASLDIPPYVYVENGKVTAQPNRQTESKTEFGWWRKGPTGADFKHEEVLDTFIDKSIDYIGQHKSEPFFLYLPLAAPHTPILPTSAWAGKSGLNEYGDFVLMVDHAVGRIQQALIDNGLDKNTILVFTADNGCAPYAGTADMEKKGHFSSNGYRGYKADIYEGGHRVPFIVKWDNRIKPNSRSDQTICLTDLMATCAGILGKKLPDHAAGDSYDLSPVWTGKRVPPNIREATVHHSVEGAFAIRQANWKLVLAPGSGGWSYPKPGKESEGLPAVQLYDLAQDPAEKTNVYAQHPQKVAELKTLLTKYIREGRSTKGKPQPYVQSDVWPGTEWM
ncbi:arylsulfatase [Telluribacter sp.]|uniref:sulfatase family protein n=1 Tax=Telluribacter sp. TaxID=1978767 RepID=UPI002E0EB4E4|nr:arylsulfatase [Telluribacter sp.]